MKIKKLFTILSLSLFTFSTVSCTGTSVPYDEKNFLKNGTETNPYQIVVEPVTIKIFAPHSSGNPEYKDQKMFKYLEKLTNLKFEFTTADTSAYSNRRSAIWNDSSYRPDLFLFNNPIAELVQFQERNFNAFVPFNDVDYIDANEINVGNIIENYMPNYKKGLENNFNISDSNGNAIEVATLSDGKMYSTLSVNDVPRDLTYKMFINREWIENCNYYYETNLPAPEDIETIEQYLEVLRAFKEHDANRNGDKNDEVPVTSKSLEYLRNFILQSYGYVSDSIEIESDGSKFTFVPTTEAYRKYLQFANTLWKEGLIDSTTFSIKTDSQMARKGIEGRLGSFVSAAAYIAVGYDYEDQYTTFGPLTSNYYTGKPLQLSFNSFKPDGACIPQTSHYVKEVARLLDIMYSDIGTQLISYGVEGEDWQWDDEEKTSWTFNVPSDWKGTQEDYRATITPNVGSASALYWSEEFVCKMNDDIIKNLNEMSAFYVPYFKVPEPNKYKFTSSEYDEISTIKAALDPQMMFLESSFVRGDKDPNSDSDWNAYQKTIKDYGADRLITIYNNCLSRYN